MPSEKLVRILKSKSPFSIIEIEAMSEADGWEWVYANAKPRKEKATQVCFTGFSANEKTELATMALASGLEVVSTVTKSLAFLCAGENAGPSKLEKAREQGVHVLTREQFVHLLETGEIQGD
jgi:DNA ligase (NAD+)